jgi:mannose-6-phosphate isomerase-like protein (cupin superfamily)
MNASQTASTPLDADDRPWGRWEEYINEAGAPGEEGYRVKRIIVSPGSRLSLQSHEHRSEHWVVVQGEGVLTVGETVESTEECPVAPGDEAFIAQGAVHRISNAEDASADLIFIETQRGDCREEDIERYEDDYGRS